MSIKKHKDPKNGSSFTTSAIKPQNVVVIQFGQEISSISPFRYHVMNLWLSAVQLCLKMKFWVISIEKPMHALTCFRLFVENDPGSAAVCALWRNRPYDLIDRKWEEFSVWPPCGALPEFNSDTARESFVISRIPRVLEVVANIFFYAIFSV